MLQLAEACNRTCSLPLTLLSSRMRAIVVTKQGSPVAPNIRCATDWPEPPAPGAFCRLLLNALEAAEGQTWRRKRDQAPDRAFRPERDLVDGPSEDGHRASRSTAKVDGGVTSERHTRRVVERVPAGETRSAVNTCPVK